MEVTERTVRVLAASLDDEVADALVNAGRALAQRDQREITVDESAVGHIGSSGTASLLVLARTVAAAGGTLHVVGLQPGQPSDHVRSSGLLALPYVVVTAAD